MHQPLHGLRRPAKAPRLTVPRILRRPLRDCRGALVFETVFALFVFSLIGVAVLTGLSTTHTSGAVVERQSIAENLVGNQMSYMFSQPYLEPPSTYLTISGVPQGYTVTCTAETYEAGNPNIEKVVVTVAFGSNQVLVLETLRTK